MYGKYTRTISSLLIAGKDVCNNIIIDSFNLSWSSQWLINNIMNRIENESKKYFYSYRFVFNITLYWSNNESSLYKAI